MLAPYTLNEQRLTGHIVSAFTIMAAMIGITYFGHHEEPDYR